MSTKKFPLATSLSKSPLRSNPAPEKISQNAPNAPSRIPKTLGVVIRSFTNIAPATSTAIGPLTIMIETFTGVVIFSPSKKKSMLVVTPKAAQVARSNRSLIGMLRNLSFPENGLRAQKSSAAPVTRN